MVKKKTKFNFKSFIVNLLRRGTYRHPARNEALKAARVSRGMYKCAMCGEIFPKKVITIDHIKPAVPVTGFTTWDDYIIRMFPEASGYQVLDRTCHDSKTHTENILRKQFRHQNKKTV